MGRALAGAVGHWIGNNPNLLAEDIQRVGLSKWLISDYQPALCPALAVFVPVSCDKGHWIEVQPRPDPADTLPASDKAYILPLPANDPVLSTMQRHGWGAGHGGISANTLITLTPSAPADSVAPVVNPVIIRELNWLGRNAVNNTIAIDNWRSFAGARSSGAKPN
jgi:hypothetical protein